MPCAVRVLVRVCVCARCCEDMRRVDSWLGDVSTMLPRCQHLFLLLLMHPHAHTNRLESGGVSDTGREEWDKRHALTPAQSPNP